MRRARLASSRSASGTVNTPAKTAATYSPTLCPHHQRGMYAARLPQSGQGQLDGENDGLGQPGFLNALLRFGALRGGRIQRFTNIHPQRRAQGFRALVHTRAEYGFVLIK
jgi:hypothetical protein